MLSKNIERWNIYTIFYVQERISSELKYKIEQDKFSTRKIVFDNCSQYGDIFTLPENEKKEKIKDMLFDKLFHISVEYLIIDNQKSLREQIKENYPTYFGVSERKLDSATTLKNFIGGMIVE